ncbi:hypothetical protein PLESTB_001835400 [Pleodorina starrii]|uniref:Uncharacterized protein n=1 Tax=Pleodorina starrii TaxID=330485 RepID=A0A9W6C0K6_9CHLO|nr:hypothetical protein PLESTM_002051500 [Pleodorina starrii]GLC62051.1 hypothetical protein PLESTB_001835400 [Pleodorina starrii]GLC65645.1 hypothetical protein PLESTF_000322300 [Pleodorina starrii]
MNLEPESGEPLAAALPSRQSRLHYSFLKLSLPLHLHNEEDDDYGSTVINGRGTESETSLELPSEDGDVDSPSSDSGCNFGSDGGDCSEPDGVGKPLDDGPLTDSGIPRFRQPIQRNHARRESLSSLLATFGPNNDFGEGNDGLTQQQRREQAQIDRASEAVREALVSKKLLDAKLCGARIPAHHLHRQHQHSNHHQAAAGLGSPSWHTHSLPHAMPHATLPAPGVAARASVSPLDRTPRSSSPGLAELVAGGVGGAGSMRTLGAVKGGSAVTASHLSHAHSRTHTAASAPNSPMAAAALRRRQLMQAARGGGGGGGGANGAAAHHPGVSTAERRRSTWRRNSIAGTDTGASLLAASTSDHHAGSGARGHGGGEGIPTSTGSMSTSTMPLMCGAELLCPGARAGEGGGGGTSDWEEEFCEDGSDGVVDLGSLVRGERRRLANVRSKVTDMLRSQQRYQGLLASRPADPSAALTLTAEELTASVIPTAARPPAGVELKVPPDDIRFSGVKLRFLMGLLEALEQQPGLCGSTSELVSRLVVPLTADHRCRLLDLIPPELRGQPHHYICHAWTCSARELLRTLRREMLPTPPPPTPPAPPQPQAGSSSNAMGAAAGLGLGKATARAAAAAAAVAGTGSGTTRAPAASGRGLKGGGGGSSGRDAGLATSSAAGRSVAGAVGPPDPQHRVGRHGEQVDRAQCPGSVGGGRVPGGLAPGAHLPQLSPLAPALASAPAPAAGPPGVRRPPSAAFEATVALRADVDVGAGAGTEAAEAGRSTFLPSIAAAAGAGGGGGGNAGTPGCCGPRGVSTPGGIPATAATSPSWAGTDAGEGGWEQQRRSQEAWKRLHKTYKEELELALDQVVWIDLVCNNQHSAVKKDYGKIARTVVSCGSTVLVLDPELTALGRTWCLYEVMHCLRCKRHLKVFRTQQQQQQQQPPARAPMSPQRGHRQTGTPRGKAGAPALAAGGDGASWAGSGNDKGAKKAIGGDLVAAAAAAGAAGPDAGAASGFPRGGCGFASECDRRWDRAVESLSIVDSRASCEADRVGILQEVLSSVGTAYVDEVVRAALRLSNSDRAQQLALRRAQLRSTLELLQPDPAVIGTEEYESNLARCREHLTSVLQQHYPEDLLRCIIPGDYVSDSARCWDMLCIFAQVLDREQFREDAKVLRNMAWLIFKRHSKRYIDVLYEKELENWLIDSLEHDRKWRRTQAKLKHDAQKKWN